MKQVWQDITGENGNCMQAAIASLLELELNEVPNFKAAGKRALRNMIDFMRERGYSFVSLVRPKHGLRCISSEIGVNGYFFAVVRSRVNDGGHHAVVIDRECNIVNPVNRKYEGMKEFEKLSEDEINGIVHVFVFNPTTVEDTEDVLRRRRMTRKNSVRSMAFARVNN